MKMNEIYAAPEVEIVDVMVEGGFYGSAFDPGQNDGDDAPQLGF